MRRLGSRLLTTSLLGAALATMALTDLPVAHAATPPLTGTVSCALTAASTFDLPLDFHTIRRGRRIGPNTTSKFLLTGELTGCTGTQTGGSPNTGPIERGVLVAKGRTTGAHCTSVSASGMTMKSVRIKWFDAAGNKMSMTAGSGAATVTGLGNGSKYSSFDPPVIDPNYVAPGIITVTVTATGKPNARAFPNQLLTITAVADQTIDSLPGRCSNYSFANPVTGLFGLDFNGVNAPSTGSIS
jgi:hypothetical protein